MHCYIILILSGMLYKMYKSINVQTQETVHYKEELDMIRNETIALSNAIFIFLWQSS